MSRSDADLLSARASVGDAFDAFYRRHRDPILSFIASRTRDAHLALDVTAEVFAAAYIARHRYKPERASARSWLIGIAKHKLADVRQREQRESTACRKLGMPRFEYTDAALERVEILIDAMRDGYLAALEQLPDDERSAVKARVIDDRAYPDIAAEHRVAPATIRKRVSRGLGKLAHKTPA